MEIKQRKRNEIEDKYKWDLSSIYNGEDEINKDIKKAKELEKEIIEFEKIELDENNLYNLITKDIELSRILEKLLIYSNLKISEDCSNTENQLLSGKVNNLIQDISVSTSFISNKILKLDEKQILKFIDNNKLLEEYRFFFELIFRNKKHMLEDKEEKILSSLSQSLNTSEEIYNMLTNLDIKFGSIEDENGNIVELTDSNMTVFSKSKNRKVRKNAFKLYYSTYGKYTNTISSLYNYHLITNKTLSKLRGYSSMLFEELYSDNLNENIYNNLIEVINSNISLLDEYYRLKKEILNIDEFHIYDRSAPFNFENDKKYIFEDAKGLILSVYEIMGREYLEVLHKAFDERWIDVYNNEGKTTGAFSLGVYDSNPYVLLNYEDTFNDVSTLAHELGHSVHSYFSIKNNPYQYYDYSLFIAEIASLTNEIIFNFTIIQKEDNPKLKLSIIENLLKIFIGNLFDATLYAEFEKDVHDKIENGEVLTSDYFNKLCYDLNNKYYGKNIIIDEEIKYRWEIYDHLYRDFYIFKYATGISCAAYCANKILNKEEGFIEKYLSFLKLGNSVYPSEALLNIGIDVNKKNFIESSVEFFRKLLDMFKETYNSIE